MIKSRKLKLAGHVENTRKTRNTYMILVGKPEGKRLLGKPRNRWEDKNKTNVRKIGWGGMD
jgi:hypothetical protein